MNVERINPEQLARPSGFSHAVSAPAARTVYLAGQSAWTGPRNSSAAASWPSSSRRSATCSSRWPPRAASQNLVSLTIYLIDVEDYQAHGKEIGAVWRGWPGPGTRPWRAWA